MVSEPRDRETAPTGCVVLAFTDVESSTALWEADSDAMRTAIALHNGLMRERLEVHDGYEVKTEGDAFMVAFRSPAAAVRWCLDCQLRLLELPWPEKLLGRAEAGTVSTPAGDRVHRGLRVRMGAHLGEPVCQLDPTTHRMDYFGPVVNRAARVGAAAHGGQVLVSEALRAALGPALAGVRLRELGSFQLKGLGAPEALSEVLPESLGARSFPPVRAQAAHRETLPSPATRTLGRESELSELERLLDSGERLITLLGPGGIGKTRLATELGRRLAARSDGPFADIVFCDLSRARNAGEVAESLSRAVGGQLGSLPTTGALIAAVGAALQEREPSLVILDNFEQVASHAPETVAVWRRACTRVAFLITSREPLGLEGEAAFRLAPLERSAAVLLFLERAATVRHGPPISRDDRGLVEAIVQRLDGIPLALELAAGRAGVLSLAQVNEQLSQRFRLLASNRRDLGPRQATLRGAIDWSWDLLSTPERKTLAQLAVFHGFTLETAEAVVETGEEGGWLLDLLQALADRSMIQAIGSQGPVRFRLLETIREYALERLAESGEGPATRLRHARAFARLAGERLTGAFVDDDRIDRQEVERERANLSAALDTVSLPAQERLRLLLALCGQAYINRPLEDLKALASLGERLAGQVTDPLLTARLTNILGVTSWLEGDQERAQLLHRQAVDEARRSGHAVQLAMALKDQASVPMILGDEATAEALLEEGVRAAETSGDPLAEARLRGNLGHVHYRRCHYPESLALFERQMELIGPGAESVDRAFADSNLAGALLGMNRVGEARRHYERALATFIRMGHFRFESMSQCGLAYVRVMQGEGALALDDLIRTLAKARRFGLKWAIAHSLTTLAVVRLESGQGAEALAALEEGIALARLSGDRNLVSMAICYRGAALALAGDAEGGAEEIARAAGLLNDGFACALSVFDGLVMLARARAVAAGRPEEALRLRSEARALHDRALGWQDGSLPAPNAHPGARFVGVALPLLARALEREGLLPRGS